MVALSVQWPRRRPVSLPPEARSWERIPSLGKDMGQKAWQADGRTAIDEKRQEGQGRREAAPAGREGKPLEGRTPRASTA
jgi:hypothetical protein